MCPLPDVIMLLFVPCENHLESEKGSNISFCNFHCLITINSIEHHVPWRQWTMRWFAWLTAQVYFSRLSVDRHQLTDHRKDDLPLADCQSIVVRPVDWLVAEKKLVDSRLTVDQLLVDCRPNICKLFCATFPKLQYSRWKWTDRETKQKAILCETVMF